MAIRLRTIKNEIVALCAAKSQPQEGDIYLNDGQHHALTLKFEKDFRSMEFIKEKKCHNKSCTWYDIVNPTHNSWICRQCKKYY